jgi:hypothetical protein
VEAIIGLGADGAKAIPEGSKDVEQEIGLDKKLKGFANRRKTEADAWKRLAHWRRGT